MRTFQSVTDLSATEFKRLTGVGRSTFAVMVDVLTPVIVVRQQKGGPRFTWGVEDMLLMTLTYWREYRTYFHNRSGLCIVRESVFPYNQDGRGGADSQYAIPPQRKAYAAGKESGRQIHRHRCRREPD